MFIKVKFTKVQIKLHQFGFAVGGGVWICYCGGFTTICKVHSTLKKGEKKIKFLL